MIKNSILDNSYSDHSKVLWLADKALTPLAISTGHRTLVDGKTYNIAIRIFAGLAAVLIAPITLLALAVKWFKMPRVNSDKNERVVDTLPPGGNAPTPLPSQKLEDEQEQEKTDTPLSSSNSDEVEVPVPATKEEAADRIIGEMEKIREFDVKFGDPVKGSWRAYGARNGETNQTFDLYVSSHLIKHQSLPDQQPLHVQPIGSFSEVDLKIIDITCDYLKVMHGIPIQVQETTITMEQLQERYFEKCAEDHQRVMGKFEDEEWMIEKNKKYVQEIRDSFKGHFPREKNKQYDAGKVLNCLYGGLKPALKTDEDKDPRVIALTNEDLYTQDMQNFVFGLAYLGDIGVGVWSNARFGDPKTSPEAFEKCLLRMMKISAHEFAHMRGMSHCTDYECNIGGYMSAKELDERPLLFCAQDTAKICYLGQTSILAHEKKLLSFFENFNHQYQLHCDFSKEIGTLKARIAKLSK